MVKNYKLVTFVALLPYFNLWDLAKFCQINKDCNQMMNPNSAKHCINYLVLFAEQGIELSPADVQETKISASRALQVAFKCLRLITSPRIISTNKIALVTGTSSIPNIKTIANKNTQVHRSLTITKV